jgi:hypothetical protein
MVDKDRWLAIIYIAPRVARVLLDYVRYNRVITIIFRPGGLNVVHRIWVIRYTRAGSSIVESRIYK